MAPLFARLVPGFAALPAAVRALHGDEPRIAFRGRSDVQRGTGAIARLLATLAGLPASGRAVPLEVTIVRDDAGEAWTRAFAGRAFGSRLRARDGLLEERMGAIVFRFRLAAEANGLAWRPAGVRWLGLPLPAAWFAGVTGHEAERDGRYAFTVAVALPLVGLLVRYEGTLDVA